jgi:hypothetical protein
MAVAISNLASNKVNPSNNFDTPQKLILRSIAKSPTGVVAIVTASENGAASTTPANTNLRVNGLKAGRVYVVESNILVSNATVANGARIQYNLTGTQTTATTIGSITASATTAFGTPAVVGFLNAAAGGSNTGAVLVNTTYGMSGASAGSAVSFQGQFTVVPQNDGDLIVQVGSGTGSTQSTLVFGSYLAVAEVTF